MAKMNKSNDLIPRIVFCLLGFALCLLCLMLFGVPGYTGLLNGLNTHEDLVLLEPSEQPAMIETEPEPTDERPGISSVHPLAADLFDLTNNIRLSAGLGVLTYAYELQEAADARAYECSIQFSHTRPNGKSCHSVVDTFDYYVTGENLLRADAPLAIPEVMMSEWMTSEGHKANILLPEFTKLAIGIYETKGVVYATQIFLG